MSNTVIDEIALEIGFTATDALRDYFGGRILAIPVRVDHRHPICIALGAEAMQRLCAVWGGGSIYVQSAARRDERHRDQLIAVMLARGISPRVIGEVVGFSERRVQQKRRELERSGLLPLILSGDIGARWPIEERRAETEHA